MAAQLSKRRAELAAVETDGLSELSWVVDPQRILLQATA